MVLKRVSICWQTDKAGGAQGRSARPGVAVAVQSQVFGCEVVAVVPNIIHAYGVPLSEGLLQFEVPRTWDSGCCSPNW